MELTLLEQIDTPALVVDLDKMEANIEKMVERARKAGIKLRPHTKTHKSPYIALKQLEAGASGITVAKLGEAEVMRKHGIRDILIAYPIIGEHKLSRLERLAADTDVITALDSVDVGRGISSIGEKLGRKLPVYVEVDTGLHRCGKAPGEETVRLIDSLTVLPYLEIRGIMTHAGHSYKADTRERLKTIAHEEGELLVKTRNMVSEKVGLDIPEVSVGSTPTSLYSGEVAGVTEMRPGTYVFNDATMMALGLVDREDCALTICATVVSKPSPERIIIDAGSKTLTSDKGALSEGFGIVGSAPSVKVSWISEEHGVIDTTSGLRAEIGDVVEIIPNHVCPAVNLADELTGVRNGQIEKIIPVEARGKNR